MLIIDLSTPRIVAHKVQNHPFLTKDFIKLFTFLLQQRNSPNSLILHTDNQQIFRSHQLNTFAINNNITFSHPAPHSHGNQVSERLNSTIKKNLRLKLVPIKFPDDVENKKKTNTDKLLKLFTYDELKPLVFEVIEEYNQTSHRGDRMFKLAPNHVKDALSAYSAKVLIPEVISKNDNSPTALSIAEYRADAIISFLSQCLLFFKDWKEEEIDMLKQLQNDNLLLKQQNQELHAKIQYLYDQEKEKERIAELDRIRKEKRQKAKKLEIRQAISFQELEIILQLIPTQYRDSLTKARVLLAILLLYLTGLRISNLLLLKRSNIEELLTKYETIIPIIKRGPAQHTLCIGNTGANLLNAYKPKYDILFDYIDSNVGLVFYSQNDPSKPISRENFNKQINKVLAKASGKLEKNIRSHSLRATFVTDLLQEKRLW